MAASHHLEDRQRQHGLRQEADGKRKRAEYRQAERVDDQMRDAGLDGWSRLAAPCCQTISSINHEIGSVPRSENGLLFIGRETGDRSARGARPKPRVAGGLRNCSQRQAGLARG